VDPATGNGRPRDDGDMSGPEAVRQVIERMRAIAGDCAADDGVGVFNAVYLQVSEMVLERLETGGVFADNAFMAELDMRFAGFWFAAYDSTDGEQPRAWAPLFERRATPGLLPVQHALAGMNAHIEHDLPLAVIRTCRDRGLRPSQVRADYEAVSDLLAEVEAEIRRTFLSDLGREVDDRIDPVAHLISAWNIDKARDVAWVHVETLWQLRRSRRLTEAYAAVLANTVGMGSRLLLTRVL
jgi:hypothetical protein